MTQRDGQSVLSNTSDTGVGRLGTGSWGEDEETQHTATEETAA